MWLFLLASAGLSSNANFIIDREPVFNGFIGNTLQCELRNLECGPSCKRRIYLAKVITRLRCGTDQRNFNVSEFLPFVHTVDKSIFLNRAYSFRQL